MWPSVLWHCWLGGRKGIRPVKKLSGGVFIWVVPGVCVYVQKISAMLKDDTQIAPSHVLEWWSVGALGSALDAAYHQNVCETDGDSGYRNRHNYKDDVVAFCREYKDDKLFDDVPGRYHSAFPTFRAETTVTDTHKLKDRLIRYSRQLDQSRLKL